MKDPKNRFSDLVLGDKIYVARVVNNTFHKSRITMTDEHGIQWFRYDRDQFDYNIHQIEYCGRISFQFEGEVPEVEKLRETEYYFKYPDGKIHYQVDCEETPCGHRWFFTREDAETYIQEHKEKYKKDS
jgi:hypothetical protein